MKRKPPGPWTKADLRRLREFGVSAGSVALEDQRKQIEGRQ